MTAAGVLEVTVADATTCSGRPGSFSASRSARRSVCQMNGMAAFFKNMGQRLGREQMSPGSSSSQQNRTDTHGITP